MVAFSQGRNVTSRHLVSHSLRDTQVRLRSQSHRLYCGLQKEEQTEVLKPETASPHPCLKEPGGWQTPLGTLLGVGNSRPEREGIEKGRGGEEEQEKGWAEVTGAGDSHKLVANRGLEGGPILFYPCLHFHTVLHGRQAGLFCPPRVARQSGSWRGQSARPPVGHLFN